jgi:hypothetical protein
MLDKNIKKVNYKITENTLTSLGYVNKREYDILKSKLNDMKNMEDKFINLLNDNDDLFVENQKLKEKINLLENQNNRLNIFVNPDVHDTYLSDFGNGIETLYINEKIDIISMKKEIKYYKYQLDGLNKLFLKNDIKNIDELIYILNMYKKNKSQILNNFYYDNISELVDIQKDKINTINEQLIKQKDNFKIIMDKLDIIKYKFSKIKPGTIIIINRKKKMFKKNEYYLNFIKEKHNNLIFQNKRKNELLINKIKMLEEDFDGYCSQQISWAKNVLGDKYTDNEIIKLLDVFNKLNKNYTSIKSDSEDEIYNIFNEMENNEIQRYTSLFKLGNNFIKNDISDKSQISEIIKNYKKIIYSYDSKDKINRFISTSKRMYRLSILITTENIIKSKCMTPIRDMSNEGFDNLLILLENTNKDK